MTEKEKVSLINELRGYQIALKRAHRIITEQAARVKRLGVDVDIPFIPNNNIVLVKEFADLKIVMEATGKNFHRRIDNLSFPAREFCNDLVDIDNKLTINYRWERSPW